MSWPHPSHLTQRPSVRTRFSCVLLPISLSCRLNQAICLLSPQSPTHGLGLIPVSHGRGLLLVGPLPSRSPGLWLVLGFARFLEIERHCSADEILQGRVIDFFALVDVDG